MSPDAKARGQPWRAFVKRLYDRFGKAAVEGEGPAAAGVRTAELLLAESSEPQAVRIAAALRDLLDALGDAELLEFFRRLADDFGPDHEKLQAAARAYLGAPDAASAARLDQTAEPRRLELLRRLNMAEGSTALIVALRGKLLRHSKAEPRLAPLAAEMQQLLSSWFNRGFLKAEKLDWHSPASVLESIIRFESVHKIRDWNSLKSRMQGNRRCFGFFHPAMSGVPLIFIEVALTREMSDDVAPILAGVDNEKPIDAPTHAVFYSINNCHAGLRGINLGDLLIKQVVLDLRTEFPSLKNFVTLSPIPGFRRWLTAQTDAAPDVVRRVLGDPDWRDVPGLADEAREPLMALCAAYLTGRGPDGATARVTDPVARFHLSNGSRLERINWLADPSPKGMAESLGLMVNYRYQLNSIDANHRAFVSAGEVAASPAVRQLSDGDQQGRGRFAFPGGLPQLWPARPHPGSGAGASDAAPAGGRDRP